MKRAGKFVARDLPSFQVELNEDRRDMWTGTEASDLFFEIIFAKSPPKMSIFWKHVTQQKVYGKIRRSGVAENHTLYQSKLK